MRLKELDNMAGRLRTVLTFDSNAFPASSKFQLRKVSNCGAPFEFYFNRKTYFVEAELVKTSSDALPSLGAIQVRPVVCVG
jgi:hypothetical protein